MVTNFTVIVAERLYLATLTHVQLLLVKDIPKTLMVGIDDTLCSIQVVSPDLKCKHNRTQFQIMGGVVFLMDFQLLDAYAITIPLFINTQPNPKPDASQYTTKSSGPSGRARTGT
ncbi:hypothetical protein Tco_0021821 [Tanacetum coccineum]